MLITHNLTWKRVSPERPVPAQMNVSVSAEERGVIGSDKSTSHRSYRGLVDKLNDGLTHLIGLATCGGACIWNAESDAGHGKAETIVSSRAGTVGVPSTLTGATRSDSVHSRDVRCRSKKR